MVCHRLRMRSISLSLFFGLAAFTMTLNASEPKWDHGIDLRSKPSIFATTSARPRRLTGRSRTGLREIETRSFVFLTTGLDFFPDGLRSNTPGLTCPLYGALLPPTNADVRDLYSDYRQSFDPFSELNPSSNCALLLGIDARFRELQEDLISYDNFVGRRVTGLEKTLLDNLGEIDVELERIAAEVVRSEVEELKKKNEQLEARIKALEEKLQN